MKAAYGLTQTDVANRIAGFVLLAVLMRPAGGWLSDRIGPVRVLAGVFALIAAAAAVTAFTPALMPVGTITFLSMAAALGAGSGAVFALVALLAPGNKVGSVTGIVGAAGLTTGCLADQTDCFEQGFAGGECRVGHSLKPYLRACADGHPRNACGGSAQTRAYRRPADSRE